MPLRSVLLLGICAALVVAAEGVQVRLSSSGTSGDWLLSLDRTVVLAEDAPAVFEKTSGVVDRAALGRRFAALAAVEPGLRRFPVLVPRQSRTKAGLPLPGDPIRALTGRILVRPRQDGGLPIPVGFATIGPTNDGRMLLSGPVGQPLEALTAIEDLAGQGVQAEAEVAVRLVPLATVDDPLADDQWHLPQIGIATAWDTTRGAGVVISVVDVGTQVTHPDLATNVRGDLGLDVVSNDTNPAPPSGQAHGTWTAGVAAARGDNSLGVTGVAPEASIAGVRLLPTNGLVTDAQMAGALGHATDVVAISNNSWGPADFSLVGPEAQAMTALQSGAANGRGGLGVVYVWAAGNGRNTPVTPSVGPTVYVDDDSGWNGYTSNRFGIAVGALGPDGTQASYSESGCNLVVCAPGGEGGAGGGIVTTDLVGSSSRPGDYTTATNGPVGTSFAAPVVSGVAALLIAAEPRLSRRDVRLVLARTATKVTPGDAGWVLNGAGLPFNHRYGYGLVDPTAALALVTDPDWRAIPAEAAPVSLAKAVVQAIPDADVAGITQTMTITAPADFRIEWVELSVQATHPYRGDLQLKLTSPEGMTSVWPFRPVDNGANLDWTFTSSAHLGERGDGLWTLAIADLAAIDEGSLDAWSVTLHGHRAPGTPTVTQALPEEIVSGSGATVLTVTGTGFQRASIVRWGGTDLATTFVSPTQLQALVPAPLLATGATVAVEVENPGWDWPATAPTGGGISGSVTVRVSEGPVITGLPPTVSFAEDTVAGPLAFTVADDFTVAADLVASVDSTNVNLFPAGSLVLGGSDSSRTLTLTPQQDRSGTCTVTVTVDDGTQTSSKAITVTVTPAADAPIVLPGLFRTTAGVAAVGTISSSDPDGDAVTVSLSTAADQGSVAVGGDGAFTWTPPSAIFTGLANFSVTGSDGGLTSDPARIWILSQQVGRSVPHLVGEPVEEVAEGEAWSWTVRVDRRDIGAAGDLTFRLLEGPAGMGFSGAASITVTAPADSAVLSWPTASDQGHAPILIAVEGEAGLNQGIDWQRVLLLVRSAGGSG